MLESIRTSWTSWRGRAVEPVIREALWRVTDDLARPVTHRSRLPGTPHDAWT
ncbi:MULTISPECIES: hypothetical protein [Streptomyces]|uniref:Uncharacterized protein n=1 Tax=Streptomyces lienomycini TaxID=284035 RepID=A0ABV9WTX8_9ACTN|nr:MULTISPECIES: hypothetical protein [Streptomyces]